MNDYVLLGGLKRKEMVPTISSHTVEMIKVD